MLILTDGVGLQGTQQVVRAHLAADQSIIEIAVAAAVQVCGGKWVGLVDRAARALGLLTELRVQELRHAVQPRELAVPLGRGRREIGTRVRARVGVIGAGIVREFALLAPAPLAGWRALIVVGGRQVDGLGLGMGGQGLLLQEAQSLGPELQFSDGMSIPSR